MPFVVFLIARYAAILFVQGIISIASDPVVQHALSHPTNVGKVTDRLWLQHFVRRGSAGFFAAAMLFILLAAGLGYSINQWQNRPGLPKLFQMENNQLIVQDEYQKELWRKSFNVLLESFSYQNKEASAARRLFWTGDLDQDGRTEVLFNLVPEYESATGGELICFSAEGRELWRFKACKSISYPQNTFSSVYRIGNFLVHSMAKGRPNSILVISLQRTSEPTQVALLDPSGALLREYWHSGHIGALRNLLQVADFNGDGIDEIYLAGVNNGCQQAELVVLDPDSFEGASIEPNTAFQIQGMQPGKELARLLFPRSCINRKMIKYNWANSLILEEDGLTVSINEAGAEGHTGHYYLDKQLCLRRFVFGDSFITYHMTLRASGLLDHTFDKVRESKEMEQIRYLVEPSWR